MNSRVLNTYVASRTELGQAIDRLAALNVACHRADSGLTPEQIQIADDALLTAEAAMADLDRLKTSLGIS